MDTPIIEGLDEIIKDLDQWAMKSAWMDKMLLAAKRYEELSRKENASKRHKKHIQDQGFTKEELFSLIENYTGGYPNQGLCLNLIKDYKEGKRWERNPIKEN